MLEWGGSSLSYFWKNLDLVPSFFSWIKFSSRFTVVLTNSLYSRQFNLYCGTRQGCPLSPILFTLAIEPLAIALRERQQIIGIIRGDVEHKITLYADDLLLFISNPQTSLPTVLA